MLGIEYFLNGFHNIVCCALEVGCGIGLCGLLSASFGTAKTVLTDKSIEVLQLLHKNIQINFTNEENKQQRFYCKYLKWAENLEEFRETDGQFDIIIASDVVYNDLNLSPLASTVAALLSDNPSSTFIIAHVSRYVMDI